jgi:hypothetical protein
MFLCPWPLEAGAQTQPFQLGARAVSVVGLGLIQGNALTSSNGPLSGGTVRLRNARTGRISGLTITDGAGLFQFRTIDPGTYVVELIAKDETVLATSQLLNVNSGETVSAVVKLPFRTSPFAQVLGHSAASAAVVTATAAAAAVLATQVSGNQVSPRR